MNEDHKEQLEIDLKEMLVSLSTLKSNSLLAMPSFDSKVCDFEEHCASCLFIATRIKYFIKDHYNNLNNFKTVYEDCFKTLNNLKQSASELCSLMKSAKTFEQELRDMLYILRTDEENKKQNDIDCMC